VPWNTVDGQNVIRTAPGHFVTSNEVEYSGSVVYADPARGVAAASYDFFNNTPDERYPTFVVNPTAGDFTVLFGSNYATGSGACRLADSPACERPDNLVRRSPSVQSRHWR